MATFFARERPQRPARRWMCVSTGKAGNAEGLEHHHAGGLVADAGQPLERLQVARHAAAVLVTQRARQRGDVARLGGRQPARADQAPDRRHRQARHRLGRVGGGEQPGVTWLTRASVHCAESSTATSKRVGVAVAQRDRRARVEPIENRLDAACLLCAGHPLSYGGRPPVARSTRSSSAIRVGRAASSSADPGMRSSRR